MTLARITWFFLTAALLALAAGQAYAADEPAAEVAAPEAEAPETEAAAAEAAAEAEWQRRMSQYEAQLAEVESRTGPYDEDLLQPLSALAELAWDGDDLETARNLLGRQLQVTRAARGLQHPTVRPVLRQIAAVAQAQGDWQAVSDQLGHLRQITAGIDGAPSAALLAAVNEQMHWELARVALDEDARRGRNFLAAYDLADEMRDMAEDLYEEESSENLTAALPWLYQSALGSYRLVEMLNAEGGIGSDTIERMLRRGGAGRIKLYENRNAGGSIGFGDFGSSRIPVVESRDELIGEAYLRDGYNILRRSARAAEGHGDAETQAMTLIHLGDYQLLSKRGSAFKSYRDAMDLLQQSGVSEADIAEYFSYPVPIPRPGYRSSFRESFEELRALRTPAAEMMTLAQGTDSNENTAPGPYLGTFTAWEMDLPATPMPMLLQPRLADSLQFNRVELRLNVNSRGGVSNVRVLGSNPDEPRIASRARRGARELRFRPAIVDGRGQRLREARLSYRYLPE